MNTHFRLSLVSIAVTALLAGCNFDHRKEIAYRMLYQENGFENDRVFLAAISARFPSGTNISELQRFTVASGGKCLPKATDRLECEIATRGKPCAARLIRVDATVEGGAIKSIGFISGGIGC